MQNTRLQTIANAVIQRQGRYQRNTHLFDLLVQLLVQGRPVTPELLASRLHRELEEVRAVLQAHPELEYDAQGNLVGSGLTLVPTAHRFRVEQRTLFAWCAFDTLTYPVELHLSAQVTSRCPVTGQSITFVATPEGTVQDLFPVGSVMSLIVPAERGDCTRATFCQQSLFFQSEQAASTFLADHPDVLLLSVEEAASVGRLVAQTCSMDAT